MDLMLEDIQPVLLSKCKLDADRLVVVGLSGGPDSLCLLDVLCRAGLPVLAAHFNHQLRPEAEADAAAVAKMASRLGVESVCGGGDVRAHADAHGISVEAAGRQLRYRFLFSEARARAAQAVAVGHTADDQAETVLMHFIRGSGLRGLSGMRFRSILRDFDASIPLVRPLLGASRAETEAYCETRGFRPLHDTSNASLDYLRNRVRLELLPLLEHYNPAIRETILRNAGVVASDWGLLDELLTAQWEHVALSHGAGFVSLDRSRLEACSPSLQRQLIRRAAEFLVPAQQIDASAAERGIDFLVSGSQQADLGVGLRIFREGDVVHIALGDAQLPSVAWPQMPARRDAILVSVPGSAALADGWSFEAEPVVDLTANAEWRAGTSDRFRAELDASTLPGDLRLRVRRPGDHFEPLGLGGQSQKLSDFFVNEKVPARARDRWPLLCGPDAIVWVPGFRLTEPFKVRPTTRRLARFHLRPPGPE